MPRKLPIFYSALLLTGVNLFLRLAGTSFQVFLSGRIGAAGIGLLQLVLSVGFAAMTAAMAGIRTATMYLTAEELGKKRPGHIKWVLSAAYCYSLVWSLSVAILLYILAPILAQHWIGDSRTVTAIRLAACFLPVNCLVGVMVGYFTAANRIGTLAVVEIAEQLFSLALTAVLLLFWAGTDPIKACLSVVFGSGCSACLTLLSLVFLRLLERPPTAPPIPLGRRLLQYALPLAVADDVKSGISTAENLMVPQRLALYPGIDPLAAFGTVTGMVFPVLMFPAAILFGLAELLIPELARCHAAGSRKRILYLSGRSLRLSLLYGCMVAGLMYLLSRRLCRQLYGSEIAGQYLQLYALLIPMLYCDAITDAMTKGLGQQKHCVRYNILTSALDVVFLFLLLPKYGMMGYFFSFLVTHLLNFVLSLRLLLRTTGLSVRLRTPVLALLCTLVATAVSDLLNEVWYKAVAFPVILLCLLFLLKILSREDLRWLVGLIKRSPDHGSEDHIL